MTWTEAICKIVTLAVGACSLLAETIIMCGVVGIVIAVIAGRIIDSIWEDKD